MRAYVILAYSEADDDWWIYAYAWTPLKALKTTLIAGAEGYYAKMVPTCVTEEDMQ